MLLSAGLLYGQQMTPQQQKIVVQNGDFFLTNDINLGSYAFDNDKLNFALNATLTAKRKEQNKRTAGFVFVGLGLTYLTVGLLVHKRDEVSLGDGVNNFLSSTLIGFGVISAGVSAPLFIGARRKQAEKEKLLGTIRGMVNGSQ